MSAPVLLGLRRMVDVVFPRPTTVWNEARSVDHADFFTLGYEGKPTAQIIELLKGAGVRRLLDIRHTPVSMYRPELSKREAIRRSDRIGAKWFATNQRRTTSEPLRRHYPRAPS